MTLPINLDEKYFVHTPDDVKSWHSFMGGNYEKT